MTTLASDPPVDEGHLETSSPLVDKLFVTEWKDMSPPSEYTTLDGVEINHPKGWSENALRIVSSKYFAEGETSVFEMVNRVVGEIVEAGVNGGYFDKAEEAIDFRDELKYILLNQMASFNSPVWFNVGVEEVPQCSACFINSVEDNMESIMDLATREALIFKYGSGSGTNLSPLRSSRRKVSGGGTASGPVSFMRGYDAFANVIKSGGKTRRAAKMVLLDADHEDIYEFINCKKDEEKKAHALIAAGYDGSVNGEAYSSVSFQNANHSIRVTDEFMNLVERPHEGENVDLMDWGDHPSEIMLAAAQAAWECGDPGIQFIDTINNWNTVANDGEINASNPCSEYLFLDDTACNLASINLMKFYSVVLNDNGNAGSFIFHYEKFEQVCRVMTTALDIIVDLSSYPTEKIRDRSHQYRTLGLGYTNLGALIMASGFRYGDNNSLTMTAEITSRMTAIAYLQSIRIANRLGSCEGYDRNTEWFRERFVQHRDKAAEVAPETIDLWNMVVALSDLYGVRNSQTTVLAPTGTISFMMDCETTGIEPMFALQAKKELSGGGGSLDIKAGDAFKIGLTSVGLNPDTEEVGAEVYKDPSRLNDITYVGGVFNTAMGEYGNLVTASDHIDIAASAQPFLSGGISKTVNVPNDTSPEDIRRLYIDAWRAGMKSVSVYRDGSKMSQPLTTDKGGESPSVSFEKPTGAVRRRLPNTRKSVTHRFSLSNQDCYFTVGEYEDGSPGELFIKVAKQGSTLAGMADAVGILTALCLQYGAPIEALADKFRGMSFEPSGWHEGTHYSSMVDYIFQWIEGNYSESAFLRETDEVQLKEIREGSLSDLICSDCGNLMVATGTCHTCPKCGANTGC